jgi:hypothetical protein
MHSTASAKNAHALGQELDARFRAPLMAYFIQNPGVRTSNAQRPLSEEAARLKTLYGQADPNEAELERRFIAEQLVSPGGDEP